eukprot:scaffold110168_cov58-Phaeocystis_antarctica.AAC.2
MGTASRSSDFWAGPNGCVSTNWTVCCVVPGRGEAQLRLCCLHAPGGWARKWAAGGRALGQSPLSVELDPNYWRRA